MPSWRISIWPVCVCGSTYLDPLSRLSFAVYAADENVSVTS